MGAPFLSLVGEEMEDNVSQLVQTIAILVAAIVFLSKQGTDYYKNRLKKAEEDKKKCLPNGGHLTQHQKDFFLERLYNWHEPSSDPETGQPRFNWYGNTDGLKDEMGSLRKAIIELNKSMSHRCLAIKMIEDKKYSGGIKEIDDTLPKDYPFKEGKD